MLATCTTFNSVPIFFGVGTEKVEHEPGSAWTKWFMQINKSTGMAPQVEYAPNSNQSIRASIQNAFCGPHKVMRSPKLCDVADVTKVAACGSGLAGWGRSADRLMRCSITLCGSRNFYWIDTPAYRIGEWCLLYFWCRQYLLCMLYTLNGTEFYLICLSLHDSLCFRGSSLLLQFLSFGGTIFRWIL